MRALTYSSEASHTFYYIVNIRQIKINQLFMPLILQLNQNSHKISQKLLTRVIKLFMKDEFGIRYLF